MTEVVGIEVPVERGRDERRCPTHGEEHSPPVAREPAQEGKREREQEIEDGLDRERPRRPVVGEHRVVGERVEEGDLQDETELSRPRRQRPDRLRESRRDADREP